MNYVKLGAIALGCLVGCGGYAEEFDTPELGTAEQPMVLSQSSAEFSTGLRRTLGSRFPCSSGDSFSNGQGCTREQSNSQCCAIPGNKGHTFRVDNSTFTVTQQQAIAAALVDVKSTIGQGLAGTGWGLTQVNAAPADLTIKNASGQLAGCGASMCSFGLIRVDGFGGALPETTSLPGTYHVHSGMTGRLDFTHIFAFGTTAASDQAILKNTLGHLIVVSMGIGVAAIPPLGQVYSSRDLANAGSMPVTQITSPFYVGEKCRLTRFDPASPGTLNLSFNPCATP